MKILHILHRSLPGTHGYAIRSKYIVECQKALSLDPIVITSPFQNGSAKRKENPEYIKNIPYHRTNLFSQMGSKQVRSSRIWISALRFPFILLFAGQVLGLAKRIKPSIIHAHSPFYCGLIGSFVSKILGIPCIYEIRGFWDGSSLSVKHIKTSLPPNLPMKLLENLAMQRADAIVVISKHLKDEGLSRRKNKKIYIVPNGVDVKKFVCREKNRKLLEEYHLERHIVLGYIGTLSAEYEGLEYLIRVMPLIIKKYPDVMLLIVGDGSLKEMFKQLSNKLGVSRKVVFAGRISHNAVSEYYSVMDICIYPRERLQETELITALKPLEAMAAGKTVIASNVGGLQELISHGETGILFEAGNINDLAEKCIGLITDVRRRLIIGKQGKDWVSKNREWSKIINKYLDIYGNLS